MKVAIAGYGIEGKASYEYWRSLGSELVIADERETVEGLPEGVETLLGPDAFSHLDSVDLIIRSPSVHPDKLPYGEKVWSSTNEFFAKCPAPIIGVTGTKGKGTTSSLITSILEVSGKTVHLIGNIGKPALAELGRITPDDIVVFELSSFQLWDVKKSPHVAVILGIEPDHLDVHHDMAEYVAAKANITRWQTEEDMLVFNSENEIATSIAEKSHAQKIRYPFDMTDFADALVIPGQHNIENAAAAIAAIREYVQDDAIIRKGLTNFTGLPHRIKFIREINGIRFYDDSYSSAPTASIAALKSFEQPKVILLGGFEKGADFTELAGYIARTASVRRAVIYGATRERVAAALKGQGVDEGRYIVLDTQVFADIIKTAVESADRGDAILLSPGCASFDMFRNFTDRGEQFIKIVESL